MGFLSWIILGLIAGAFVGGYLGSRLGLGGGADGVNIGSIVTATAGAFVLLFIYKLVK